MACSMGTSVGYDRARNKVSGGPMAHPLAHCQLESRFQSDTFVSTLMLSGKIQLQNFEEFYRKFKNSGKRLSLMICDTGISLRWLNRGVAIQTPHHHSVVIFARNRYCTSELASAVGQAMAPKTALKTKEKGLGLSAPVVSAADIAKAKEALLDDEARKRENSSMLFWPKKTGNKEAYDKSPMQARREFLIGWFADKLSKGDVKSSSSKDIGSTKKRA